MHVRMSQKLALQLNVAVGKLRGWIRDRNDAREEFGKAAEEAGADIDKVFDKEIRAKTHTLLLKMSTPERMSA